MNIHAITYTNIGPFTDTRSVIFQSGKFLIKASIGSGKSFLFFDGPIFGLYKYASRPMLNKTSSEGEVKIVFSVDGEYYMIIRSLQHGKKKDKVQSQFFRVTYTAPASSIEGDKEVIQIGDYIQNLISQNKIEIDEIVFKSDTELQNTIQDILPPKEVLTTTQFLLQDSDNFFAMTPADRITVFKNIFNLLSIDDAKDTIAEQRRDLQARIRVMQDSDESDQKLQSHISQLLTNYQKIKDNKGPITRLEDLALVQSTASDQRSVQSFDVSIIDTESLHQQAMGLKSAIEKLQSQQTILNQLNERLFNETQQGKDLKKNQSDLLLQKERIEKELTATESGANPTKLTEQIQALIDQQKELTTQFDRREIQDLITTYANNNPNESEDTGGSNFPGEIDGIQSLSSAILMLRNQGALLRQQQEATIKRQSEYEEQLAKLVKYAEESQQGMTDSPELKNAISTQEATRVQQRESVIKQRTSLEEKKETYDQQVKDLQAQLTSMQKDLNTAKRFPCSKINADCPFIEQIASASLGKFTKQVQLLEEQLAVLKQSHNETKRKEEYHETVVQFKKISDQIQLLKTHPEQAIPAFFEQQEKQHQRRNDEVVQFQKKIQEANLEAKNSTIALAIKELGALLTKLNWKKVDEVLQTSQVIDKQIKELQQQLTSQQNRFQQRQEQEKQLLTLDTRLQESEKQLVELGSSVRLLQEKITITQKDLADDILTKKLQSKEVVQDMILSSQRIIELAQQSSSKQQQLKQLQIDETRIKNLYHIFSKELMYVVLEDTLPVLFDIINAYLAQIVEYSINFALVKTASDKLELEVTVHDSKGERSINSLSGGQKVVLKLVRILAIVSYTRGHSLFLDETINNLDADTVSRVATMLEDFVRQREVKLYVVTHSPQIQSMNIRDSTIVL